MYASSCNWGESHYFNWVKCKYVKSGREMQTCEQRVRQPTVKNDKVVKNSSQLKKEQEAL